MKSKEYMQFDYLFFSRNREFCLVQDQIPLSQKQRLTHGPPPKNLSWSK